MLRQFPRNDSRWWRDVSQPIKFTEVWSKTVPWHESAILTVIQHLTAMIHNATWQILVHHRNYSLQAVGVSRHQRPLLNFSGWSTEDGNAYANVVQRQLRRTRFITGNTERCHENVRDSTPPQTVPWKKKKQAELLEAEGLGKLYGCGSFLPCPRFYFNRSSPSIYKRTMVGTLLAYVRGASYNVVTSVSEQHASQSIRYQQQSNG